MQPHPCHSIPSPAHPVHLISMIMKHWKLGFCYDFSDTNTHHMIWNISTFCIYICIIYIHVCVYMYVYNSHIYTQYISITSHLDLPVLSFGPSIDPLPEHRLGRRRLWLGCSFCGRAPRLQRSEELLSGGFMLPVPTKALRNTRTNSRDQPGWIGEWNWNQKINLGGSSGLPFIVSTSDLLIAETQLIFRKCCCTRIVPHSLKNHLGTSSRFGKDLL